MPNARATFPANVNMTPIDPRYERLCAIGLGYIDLPTASLLTSNGFDSQSVDVKPRGIATVNSRRVHSREPELDILVKPAFQSARLKANTQPDPSTVFTIAVPTSFPHRHAPKLGFVKGAVHAITHLVSPAKLVILESANPLGSTEEVRCGLNVGRPGLRIVSRATRTVESRKIVRRDRWPARVRPGRLVREPLDKHPIAYDVDAISIGATDNFCQQFVGDNHPTTNSRTAKLTIPADNIFRDAKVPLANEPSQVCYHSDIDVRNLTDDANHPQANLKPPGSGVAAHGIAVDSSFLVESAHTQTRLVRAARAAKYARPHFFSTITRAKASRTLAPTLTFFALPYNARVGDIPESPAIDIAMQFATALGRPCPCDQASRRHSYASGIRRPLADLRAGKGTRPTRRLARSGPPQALEPSLSADIAAERRGRRWRDVRPNRTASI